jgi:hypothetical protein
MRRPGRRAAPALLATLALLAPAAAAPATGPLALLPIQDRAGDPEAAAAAARAIRDALAARHALLDPERVRGALRAARVRDSGALPPAALDRLAGDLGAASFFSCTLHRAGADPGMQVIVAGRLLRPDRGGIAWAGFESASRLDGQTWLGRGTVDDRLDLVRAAARRLAGALDAPGPLPRARPAAEAVRVRPVELESAGTIAVIPFDATTEAPGAAEIATDLALTLLHRRGARLAVPGAVEEVLRRRGILLRGEIDTLTRAALRAATGADLLFTGTVEALAIEGGGEAGSEPRAAIGARLVDAADGRILWAAAQERRGFDHEGLFQRGRVHSLGRLAFEMMDAFVASFAGPAVAPAGRLQP